jgi:hypothetical protein
VLPVFFATQKVSFILINPDIQKIEFAQAYLVDK